MVDIYTPRGDTKVFSPLPKGKALSLRPVNVNLTQGRLCGNVLEGAGSKTKELGIHRQSGELQKSLPSGHIQFVSNDPRQTCGLLPAFNSDDKLGCCPLRPSAAVYSTPPYYTKPPSNTGSQRFQRNPKIMKFTKASDTAKNSTVNDPSCLSSVKAAALTTIKVATNCVEDDASSEDCKGYTKMFEGPTASTALVSSSNGSVKTSGSSQGYSTNFNPQLTSTPQRSRLTTNSSESSPQTKKLHPPKETRPTDDLSILLDIIEEERKAGLLKMLPLKQLPVMAKNSYVSNSVCASTNSYSFDISNNNTRKLPTMKAIGAPKDASTPIVYSNITERSCKFSQSHRRRHESNESRSHTSTVVGGLWRPW